MNEDELTLHQLITAKVLLKALQGLDINEEEKAILDRWKSNIVEKVEAQEEINRRPENQFEGFTLVK